MKTPYLTNSIDLAVYYAEEAAEDCGGKPIILMVDANPETLLVDYYSLNEPVGYGSKSIENLESRVKRQYIRLARIHPEWTKEGYLHIPENEYTVSLNTVGSCRSGEIIPPKNIKCM